MSLSQALADYIELLAQEQAGQSKKLARAVARVRRYPPVKRRVIIETNPK